MQTVRDNYRLTSQLRDYGRQRDDPVKPWDIPIPGDRRGSAARAGGTNPAWAHGGRAQVPHNVGLMSVEHYENFLVASWLCRPAETPIEAIYHFARTAGDDLADEGDASPELRRRDLDEYAADLVGLWQKPAQASRRWPSVFQRLAKAVDQHGLPQPLLLDLLSAFRQDTPSKTAMARGPNCWTTADARPIRVGRLLLHLYGVKGPREPGPVRRHLHRAAADQLLADPSIDWPRGRCCFPQDDLARHGLSHIWQAGGHLALRVVTRMSWWPGLA